ncbi:transglycosylase SLT domain-containing protein [Nocardia sp. NBC_01009]|uniref:transglycosylase SLT domain-containing protein n=1 Tax=Nocardia sp. NBC_01009 TaxID=2975996 RepID=UPI00386F4E0F|nr:transglycosylase SLT domain-containing protein [Nocardia sp. NBC_01009]
MPTPNRDSLEPGTDEARDARVSATTTAPRRPTKKTARHNQAKIPPPVPTPAATSAAPAPPATATARGPLPPLAADSSTSTTGSTSSARPDAAAWAGAPAIAAPALGAIAAIAAQYGDGAPTADTGQTDRPPDISDGRPTGPVAWDGMTGSQYAANNHNTAGKVDATQALNTELGRILDGAVDNTVQGRAAMGSIIAEVNTALTALGSVQDTAAGRNLLIATLGNALHRAGNVLGQGQAAAAITADRVAALADRYMKDSRPARPRPARRASHPDTRGPRSGPPRTRPAGQQGQWINEAMQILRQNGYDTRQIDPADIAAIIQHESGGNPNAINLWDSNAAAGIPSKGLMQTIDPTFNSYALPGHRDIWNPVDNIIAGVRYSIDRYGSVSNVPGIVQMRSGGGYVGY